MQFDIKKRLKKVRVIDYLFLLLIIAIGTFAVFYFKREKTYVYVDLTYQRENDLQPPEFWQVQPIKVGDIVYNSLGNDIATVVDVEKNIWGSGRRTSVELQLKVQAIYDTRTKKFVLDGNPLLIGNELTVNFGTSKFDGQIKNVYLQPEQRYEGYRKAKALLKIKYRNIEPWHAEALKNYIQVDSKGQPLVKVLSVDIHPAEIMTMNYSGQTLRAQHPFKKDADITLELPRVLCLGDSCFYNGYNTFEVGTGFWADNGKTQISEASIISVEISDATW